MADAQMDLELSRSLGRIEGKLDAVITEQALARTERVALDKRTRVLENWRAYVAGISAAVSIVVTLLIRTFTS